MEGLFGNILYLIPIAFFIAIRILNAKSRQSGKTQQKKPAGKPIGGGLGELIKQIQEVQRNPDYRGGKVEAREVDIPSVAPRRTTGSNKPGEPKKNNTVQKKQTVNYRPIAPDTEPLSEIKNQTGTPGQKTPAVNQRAAPLSVKTGILPQGLTPLQQAVVWSEILGQPKSLGGIT